MRAITGRSRLIGLLASPSSHSRSPALHNAGFERLGLDYVYLAFDVPQRRLREAVEGLRAIDARGWNLSMPNKKAMIPLLDRVSPQAERIGSVNTVVHEKGVLTGYNTDGIGFVKALQERNIDLSGQKITLSGSGGAGLAVVSACISEGAEVSVFNRRGRSDEAVRKFRTRLSSDEQQRLKIFDANDHQALSEELACSMVYINATPLGMARWEDQSPLDSHWLHPSIVVCDLIYTPKKTRLLKMAETAGCRTMNGEAMLWYQAAEAFELWTGYKMPIQLRENNNG